MMNDLISKSEFQYHVKIKHRKYHLVINDQFISLLNLPLINPLTIIYNGLTCGECMCVKDCLIVDSRALLLFFFL